MKLKAFPPLLECRSVILMNALNKVLKIVSEIPGTESLFLEHLAQVENEIMVIYGPDMLKNIAGGKKRVRWGNRIPTNLLIFPGRAGRPGCRRI